jgi:enoyl-CoA hydratase/carnithine racemase
MEDRNILVESKDHVRTLTIEHPPANAWNLQTLKEFEVALSEAEDDHDVRVVIITGAGEKCFSAGFDLGDAANVARTAPLGQALWRRVDRFPKPVIAAINGIALGGGCELALACHFRLMSAAPKAKLGLTELNLGLLPAWGGTQRMTRLVGRSRALDMILFSRKVDASEALEMGLVDELSAPGKLMDDAMELARRLAERPPLAVACVLRAVAAGVYEGIEQGLAVEEEGSRILAQSKDAKEGIVAFLERREPVFTGE